MSKIFKWAGVLSAAAVAMALQGASPAASAPVGVFDSGLGGLTVLERLLDVDMFNNSTGKPGADGVPDFAAESFQYLGDQANMPYGDYAAEGKSDYLKELIWKDAQFLLGEKFFRDRNEAVPTGAKPRAKIIVIACNTATAWGLSLVRERLAAQGDGTKVVGVIEAGVRATLDGLGAGPTSEPFAIGVLATPGTISSGAYERTLRAELAARGVKAEVPVIGQGCPGLADAVEACCPAADAIAAANMKALAERHAASCSKAPIRAVILGCTHFPFVQKALERTVAELRANGANFAADFRFVDPAIYTAAECYAILRDGGLLAPRGKRPAPLRAFLSVADPTLPKDRLTADGQLVRSYKYGRDVSDPDTHTKPVPFTRANFGDDVFAGVGRLLPKTAALLDARRAARSPLRRQRRIPSGIQPASQKGAAPRTSSPRPTPDAGR